jgi:site-specific DNA-methyltransferase (adenine-specific)
MKSLPDKHFDLCIADPAYGRGEDGGRKRSKAVLQKNGSRIYVEDGGYEKMEWDKEPPKKEVFDEIFRISKNQIIFGVNYLPWNFGPGRIIWDKCNDGSDQSDCEIAYNSMTERVDVFRFMWRGMMQGKSMTQGTVQQGNKAKNERRIHPTQKPVALYKWILTKYAEPGYKIFDPFLGSGSSRIAAHDLGFDFCGTEINQKYYADMARRFQQHISQIRLGENV